MRLGLLLPQRLLLPNHLVAPTLLALYVSDHCHTVFVLVNTELQRCYQLCELCTSPLRLWQATAVSVLSYSGCGVPSL